MGYDDVCVNRVRLISYCDGGDDFDDTIDDTMVQQPICDM